MSMSIKLAAALESQAPVMSTPMISIEDYMELRAALEEIRDLTDLSSAVKETHYELFNVEEIMEGVRSNEVTPDQVTMQVNALTKATGLMGESNVDISMEDLQTLEQISLQASIESKGIIARAWAVFVSLLKAIKDAFVKAWRWLFRMEDKVKSSEKEAEEVKDMVVSVFRGKDEVEVNKIIQDIGEDVSEALDDHQHITLMADILGSNRVKEMLTQVTVKEIGGMSVTFANNPMTPTMEWISNEIGEGQKSLSKPVIKTSSDLESRINELAAAGRAIKADYGWLTDEIKHQREVTDKIERVALAVKKKNDPADENYLKVLQTNLGNMGVLSKRLTDMATLCVSFSNVVTRINRELEKHKAEGAGSINSKLE